MPTPKIVSINPSSFVETSLCDLCFEDALRIGSMKSAKLASSDFKETSLRFCVDGLYKWYKSFSKQSHNGSVFSMVRDASWYWSSFCGSNDLLINVTKEYFILLRDITENTSYTDLAERMDEAKRVKEIGRGGRPLNFTIPFESWGIISDCATAIGVPFSLFYQVGLGKALSANRDGLYQLWSKDKVQPLFDEIMASAKSR